MAKDTGKATSPGGYVQDPGRIAHVRAMDGGMPEHPYLDQIIYSQRTYVGHAGSKLLILLKNGLGQGWYGSGHTSG